MMHHIPKVMVSLVHLEKVYLRPEKRGHPEIGRLSSPLLAWNRNFEFKNIGLDQNSESGKKKEKAIYTNFILKVYYKSRYNTRGRQKNFR
jgi:hypothetical protein